MTMFGESLILTFVKTMYGFLLETPDPIIVYFAPNRINKQIYKAFMITFGMRYFQHFALVI